MKIFTKLVLIIGIFTQINFGQTTVTWNFGTLISNADPSSGTPVSNLSISALSRGNNNGTTTFLDTSSRSIGYPDASGSFNAGAAARIASLSLDNDGSAYFEFTLTPSLGYIVVLSSISFGTRSTSTGPQAFTLRYSKDNYSSDLYSGILQSNSEWSFQLKNKFFVFSNSGTAVTFRLYGYNGTGSPNPGTANWRIDDLSLELNVITDNEPHILLSPYALKGFNYVFSQGPSLTQEYVINGYNLNGDDLTLTPPISFEISTDGGTNWYSSPISYTNYNGNFYQSIIIRLKSFLSAGNYSEAILHSGGGASNQNLICNGTVFPFPSFNNVVIAEIYGGGGNTDSYYRYDYIILFNPTAESINLNGWSIQYASATGNSWQKTNLSGNINANSYFAIREAQGSGGSVDLPFTPNVIGSFAMSSTSGKVALLNNQTLLNVSNPIGSSNVIDFVGYGLSANAYEGSGPTASTNNTSSIRRKDNSGNSTYGVNGSAWDTDNNQKDFYIETDLINNAPLPVELSSFSASVVGNTVKLNWKTETEVNNYGFDIERSLPQPLPKEGAFGTPLPLGKGQGDGLWTKIGFVNGNGNSNSPKSYTFTDTDVLSGKYSYRLKQIDNDGQFEYSKTIEVDLGAPKKFELSQNYPNPFNPTTTIRFSLPDASLNPSQGGTLVKLTVYNVLGQQVAVLVNDILEAGVHTINFNASELNSGIYIYKLEAGSLVQTRKMTLIK